MSTDSNLLKSHQPWRRLKQESRYLNNTNAKPRRKKKKKNLEQKTVKRARSKILAASQRGTNYDLKRLFLSADKDKDKALSFNEWENILSKHRSGVSFSLDDVKSLFVLVNESKNGYISWKEFLNFVDPNAVVKQSSTNYNSERTRPLTPIQIQNLQVRIEAQSHNSSISHRESYSTSTSR